MYWDEYFLSIAQKVGEKSHCLSRQIGSVLVKDNRIIATGYSGPPAGIKHCENRNLNKELICPRRIMGYDSGEGLEWCPSVHSEINTIIQAAKFGVPTDGSTLYCFCNIPCLNCSKELVNAGVKEIVCLGLQEYYGDKGLSSFALLQAAGVIIKVFDLNSKNTTIVYSLLGINIK